MDHANYVSQIVQFGHGCFALQKTLTPTWAPVKCQDLLELYTIHGTLKITIFGHVHKLNRSKDTTAVIFVTSKVGYE